VKREALLSAFRKLADSSFVSMLSFDRHKVCHGVWGEVKVAVKRILLRDAASNEQEEKALKMLDHTNVIKLFHVENNQDLKYFNN
jgi:hypothetical protein